MSSLFRCVRKNFFDTRGRTQIIEHQSSKCKPTSSPAATSSSSAQVTSFSSEQAVRAFLFSYRQVQTRGYLSPCVFLIHDCRQMLGTEMFYLERWRIFNFVHYVREKNFRNGSSDCFSKCLIVSRLQTALVRTAWRHRCPKTWSCNSWYVRETHNSAVLAIRKHSQTLRWGCFDLQNSFSDRRCRLISFHHLTISSFSASTCKWIVNFASSTKQ